jgi:pre-mRNA-splicing factor SYF1
LEEDHGLARHAMAIYSRASKAVEREEAHTIYNIYIKKAIDFFGITSCRTIFPEAIESLPEERSREMSLKFAQVERNLGEIDRARVIYAHCAEICDPEVCLMSEILNFLSVAQAFLGYLARIRSCSRE